MIRAHNTFLRIVFHAGAPSAPTIEGEDYDGDCPRHRISDALVDTNTLDRAA